MAEQGQVPIRFSPRERAILALLAGGWSEDQIGRQLLISPHTVRTHLQNITAKLAWHNGLDVTEREG